MKRFRRIAGLQILLLVLCMGLARGSENTRLFLDGISEFGDGNYTGAIEKMSRVAESGVRNGSLYYNLGNAYLKAGDLGNAVLWYNRAMALIPNDPDLKFNLAYARSLVKDIPGDEKMSALKIIFFWKYLLSDKTVQWTAVILNAIFWLGILFFLFIGRRPSRILSGTVGLAALIFIATAGVNAIEKRTRHLAVILPETAAVMSAPTEDATELFNLHAGTSVTVERRRGDYIKIYFSKDKIGWIKKDHVGIV